MRLLRVELTRFRWRRAVVLLVLGGALFTALVAGSTVYETRPVTAADRAEAQAMAERETQSAFFQRELARCERNPQRFVGPGTTAADCEQIMPRADWFLQRSELSLAEENRDSGIAVVVVLVGVAIIAGTTFAGADWASGSMSNQLLFDPRRGRVWSAKAGAVLLGTLATTAVLLGAFWLTLYLVAEARGIATGATVQAEIRWTAARGALLAAAAATGSYALTMLLRHTVGTLAALFAYAIGGEIVMNTLPVDGIGRWSLSNNTIAWLTDGYEYFDPSLPCGTGQACQMGVLTLADSAVFLGGLLLAVAVVSVVAFRRRDVP
jgi:hypothetical protein